MLSNSRFLNTIKMEVQLFAKLSLLIKVNATIANFYDAKRILVKL